MKMESPLILMGIFLIIAGILIILFAKLPFLAKFTGNIQLRKDNFILIFPVTLCIIISITLTFILNLVMRK
ncbi:DUF2905 domain-containing protein [candidate division WOR-3 bacterium]|nr:DUF2905 domain-containing protein [candidate division WOR-3 bacterium]